MLTVHHKFDKGGETFWLSSRTFAHVVESQDGSEIYTYDIDFDAFRHASPVRIGSIPSKTAANFRYNPITGILVFSAYVYDDGDLNTVDEQDKKWDERGNSALVFDATYVRHWDVWQGKKRPQLFSVRIAKATDGNWSVGDKFTSPLKGTKHVRRFCYLLPVNM